MIALTLRLEDEVHEALRREAFDRRVSVSEIIRERIAGSEPQGEPSDAKVEAAARRLFGATVGSMDCARELARVALTAPPLIECPHWAPGKITFRNGCTSCEAVTEQGENR